MSKIKLIEAVRSNVRSAFRFMNKTISRKIIPLLALAGMSALPNMAHADISGQVFLDLPLAGAVLDPYGVKHVDEPGVAGVTVTVFPGGATTTTAADGTYTFLTAVAPDGPLRVEFSGWPSYLQESPDAGGANTSVQFVTAPATDVDLGIMDPQRYSETEDPVIIMPTWTSSTAATGARVGIYSFDYSSSGRASNGGYIVGTGTGPIPVEDVTKAEVGSTWGIAPQGAKQRYFASSVIRRHVGLADPSVDGPGNIFVVDRSGAPALAHTFNVNGIVTANGGTVDMGTICRDNVPANCHTVANGGSGVLADYVMATSFTSPSVDLDAADKVGKVAFGDMDMQPGTNTLWAVNLNQKALMTIDVSNDTATALPGVVDQFLISGLPGIPTCTNGEIRPWGISFAQGNGYLGAVCDASAGGASADLMGYVLSFDPSNVPAGFATVISFPLDYNRDGATDIFGPWSSDFADAVNLFGSRWAAPQPIVSDIEFDPFGNLVVGVLDRGGLLIGAQNSRYISGGGGGLIDGQTMGDIIMACKTAIGFDLEDSGICPQNTNDTNEGFNANGEFFHDNSGDGEDEASQGSLAILHGSKEIVSTHLDAHPVGVNNDQQYWNSQGIHFYDTGFDAADITNGVSGTTSVTPGDISDYYNVYYSGGGTQALLAKAGGIGDIELLTAPAPIEIGNLIWEDINGDGVQGPAEPGIAGVTVQLYDSTGTTLIDAVVTDANGNYIFSNDPLGTDSASHHYNLTALVPNTAYTVRVPNVAGGSKQAALGTNNLTLPNIGAGANTNLNDSDGVASGNDANIPVLAADIPIFGGNNHSFDMGFSAQRDLGDAPDTYSTLSASGGPSHTLADGAATLFIGTAVDDETDGQPTVGADGDDTNGDTPDDEDVAFTNTAVTDSATLALNEGDDGDLTLNVTNNSGSAATLYGWIDFNGDGDFADAGEFAQIAVPDSSTDVDVTLPFIDTPYTNTTNTYARFRLTTDMLTAADFGGAAADGEIEDHPVVINQLFDWADAPDAGAGTGPGDYPTLDADNGPSHGLRDGLFLGALVDAEADGQPSTLALVDGDDTVDNATEFVGTGPADDEDGIVMAAQAMLPVADVNGAATTAYNLTGITATNDTGGPATLVGYIDFNRDGDFDDAGETSGSQTIAAGTAAYALGFSGITNISSGDSVVRLRISTDAAAAGLPTGGAVDGEVEDHPIVIKPVVRALKVLIPAAAPDLFDLVSGTLSNVGASNAGATGYEPFDPAGPAITISETSQVGNTNAFTSTAICTDELGNVVSATQGPVSMPSGVATANSFDSSVITLAGNSKEQSTITCTFTNQQGTSIAVVKNATPADDTDFGFTSTWDDGSETPIPASFTLDGELVDSDADTFINQVSGFVANDNGPRILTVTENAPPAGWAITAASCTVDGNPAGSITSGSVPSNAAVTVTVSAIPFGSEVNCAFTNIELVTVGSVVWLDSNVDGMQQNSEALIEGATVELWEADGTTQAADAFGALVLPVVTGALGEYNFNNLLPGDYVVSVDVSSVTPVQAAAIGVVDPTQLVPTRVQNTNANSDINLDSNIDAANDQTAATDQQHYSGVITLTAGSEPGGELRPNGNPDQPNQGILDTLNGNMTVDFAFFEPVSVGSVVFQDNDDSGIQEVGELGIAGVTVQLFDGVTEVPVGPDGILGTADDGLGGVTTVAGGEYNFSGLEPGSNYRVRFTPPAGLFAPSTTQVPDPDLAGDVNLDSNLNLTAVTPAGSYDTGIFELTNGGEPTGAVENDPDSVKEVDPSGTADANSNLTVDAGFIPLMNLGNLVWEDEDGLDTANNSTYQDGVDTPIAGATVELFEADGVTPANDAFNNPVGSITTAASGLYNFTDLAPGDYVVRVTPPAGYEPVNVQVPDPNTDDDNDSNLDTTAGGLPAGAYQSGVVTLTGNAEPEADADADENTDEENLVTGADGDNGNLTVDFGFFQPLSLGTVVYDDGNNDGVADATDDNGTQEAGEAGINGATVQLFDSAGNEVNVGPDGVFNTADDAPGGVVTATVSGVDGTYNFSNLPGDDYVVRITPPSEYVPSSTQVADGNSGSGTEANLDSNLDLSRSLPFGTWESGVITLDAGTEPLAANEQDPGGTAEDDPSDINDTVDANGNLTYDFGFKQQVAVGNYVWLDNGAVGGIADNGIVDGGEQGIANVTVQLFAAGDVPGTDPELAETTTDSDGFYLFDYLDEGDYFVHIPDNNFGESGPLNGLRSSSPDSVGDTADDDDADENGNNTLVDNGVSSDDINLAVDQEPGLADETGAQSGGVQSAQDDDNTNLTVDFGFVPQLLGTIGNYVWIDEDSDGEQDAGEPGIPNVSVELFLDADGNGTLEDNSGAGGVDETAPVDTTVTDANGGYLFTDLPAGDYFVDVDETTIPVGMTQTPTFTNVTDGGDADTVDDDGDFGNKDHAGDGYPITLDEGEDNLTADFGYNWNPDTDVNNNTGQAALGDKVWIDSDGDGVLDPNETPVSGVELTLTNIGPDGVLGTPDDIAGGTQTTDANGNYMFDNLDPGAYIVEVTDSAGASHDVLDDAVYAQTADPDHFGASTTEADPGEAEDNITSSPVILAPGDVFLNVDFGYQPIPDVNTPFLGSIGDTVWYDTDSDGSGESIAPVDGGTALTQGDDTGNADPTESGIPGVTVSLIRDADGDGVLDPGEPVIATDITDDNGQYLFEDLPITAGAGTNDYIVWVNDSDNVLDGLVQTYDDDGVNTTPNTSVVTDLGEVLPKDVRDQDFGYVADDPFNPDDGPLGSIGDTVWGDLDSSGGDQSTQGDEPGLQGVVVNLYADDDQDGVADDPANPIASTTTDAQGQYLFDQLPLGGYIVGVDDTTLPDGYDTTSTYLPDGTPTDAEVPIEDDGATGTDLGDGVVITAVNPHDRDQDFSYPPEAVNDPLTGKIGDTIYAENDGVTGQGATDLGFNNVTVHLFDSNDDLVESTTTDIDGHYLFEGLDPTATYSVVVDGSTIPEGYGIVPASNAVYTVPVAGSDPEGDGDNVSLVDLGEDTGPNNFDGNNDNDPAAEDGVNLGQDFGYPPLEDPADQAGSIGDTIWFDEDTSGGSQITQGTEPGLEGVSVSLFDDVDDDGIPDAGELIETQLTDEDGTYLFQGLPLNDDGSDTPYIVVVDTSTLPPYVSTEPTYDPEGNTTDSLSVVALTIADPDDRDQDYSYPPYDEDTPIGAIGDTIWLDLDDDDNGPAGAGDESDVDEPAIEGVQVNLLADTDGDDIPDTVVATQTTDENGQYLFTNLDPTAIYAVEVDSTNFDPDGPLEDMANVSDPEDDDDNTSIVDLGAMGDDGVNDPDGDNGVNLGQDFGYLAPDPARVGTLVWFDTNANGVYEPDGQDGIAGTDDDEAPIEGVTLELYRDLDGNGEIDPGEPLMGTQTTKDATDLDDNGTPADPSDDINYIFEGLPHDTYVVKVTDDDGVLNGYWHSLGDQNDDGESKVETYALDVSVDDEDLTGDFGYYVEPGSLGNQVWEDIDGNGVYDPLSDPGIENVDLILTITYPGAAPITVVTTTDAGGKYEFDQLLLDEDYNGIDPAGTPIFTVVVDPASEPAYLDQIFNDHPTPNVDTTDPGGNVTDEDDADVGGDDPAAELGHPYQGGVDPTNDFGYQPLASIGNRVWLDFDGDGIQDANEDGIPNVEVTLTLPASLGGATLTTFTGPDGEYLFTDLIPVPATNPDSSYVVTVTSGVGTPLENLLQTYDEDNGTETLDHTSDPIDLSPNEEHLTADFGYNVPVGSIGDTIWIDTNEDGIQTPGEIGIPGVTVLLFDELGVEIPVGPDGVLGTGDDAPGGMVTNAQGKYLFTGLPAGIYGVEVVQTAIDAAELEAHPLTDPDVRDIPEGVLDNKTTVLLELVDGAIESNLDADFGYSPKDDSTHNNSVGDTIFIDEDSSGTQGLLEEVVPNVTVTLLDSTGTPISTVTTDENGQYLFTGLPDGNYEILVTDGNNVLANLDQTADPDGGLDNTSAVDLDSGNASPDPIENLSQDFGYVDPNNTDVPASLGDYVWLDSNMDGIQDPDEEGIPNVTVELWHNGAFETSVVTGPSGEYLFPDLIPGDDYETMVDVTTLPTGLVATYDEDDGTMSPNDASGTIVLADNEQHLTADFGYAPAPGSIGDRIWADVNEDGVQDPGELGIPGVTVTLTPPTGVDIGAGPSNPITTTTDDFGMYLFPGLPEGIYTVEVDEGTLPPGYLSHDLGDPDVSEGNEPTGDSTHTVELVTEDGAVTSDLDSDFGYHPDPTTGENNNEIGDTVFIDNNGDGDQDVGEPGVPGVTVALYIDENNDDMFDGGDTLIASTETDADGKYLFTGVPDGEFVVVVTDAGGVLTGLTQTADPEGVGDNQSSVSFPVADGPALSDDLRNFGYLPPFDPPSTGIIGDTIFFDVDGDGAQGATEDGIEGVTVRLYDEDNNLIRVDITDENGSYLFTGLEVEKSYTVIVDTTSLPGGGTNWTNTADPDTPGVGDSTSTVDLTLANPVDLDQDFGYGGGNNSLSGTIWPDANADGFQDEGETFEGVTVELLDPVTGNIIDKATTDANGDYSFTNLPDGSYTVRVTDENNILAGFEHTDGTTGQDQNSQDDTGSAATGYVVDLDPAGTNSNPVDNVTSDFGYKPTLTTPITLGSFASASLSVGEVEFSWTTESEVANVGFMLYQNVDGEWSAINAEIIPAVGESLETVSYGYRAQNVTGSEFVLTDIDSYGNQVLHGPFALGETFGATDKATVATPDWDAIGASGAQVESKQRAAKQKFGSSLDRYLGR